LLFGSNRNRGLDGREAPQLPLGPLAVWKGRCSAPMVLSTENII
jgi:hypothetical protein